MAIYTFRNTETDEIFEVNIRMSDYDQYKIDNPTHERYHASAPAFADSVRIGVKKTDNGFKEVLQRIHEKTAGSQLNKTTNQI